jgi:DNA-directed RNA polymerase specialized sigma subunit
MKEIGSALGLSESRISQTHDSILLKLREVADERGEEAFI